jgi:hypothetical protein
VLSVTTYSPTTASTLLNTKTAVLVIFNDGERNTTLHQLTGNLLTLDLLDLETQSEVLLLGLDVLVLLVSDLQGCLALDDLTLLCRQ